MEEETLPFISGVVPQESILDPLFVYVNALCNSQRFRV